jgi:serine/threonine protein kinase
MSLSRSTTVEDSAKTMIYCAPEVVAYEPRNKSSDIWSLGCVFLEMATTLKDASLEDMRQHFKQTGGDFWFWKNSKGIETWSEKLRKEGLDWDNAPLDWVARMLRATAGERPAGKEIAETIGTFK